MSLSSGTQYMIGKKNTSKAKTNCAHLIAHQLHNQKKPEPFRHQIKVARRPVEERVEERAIAADTIEENVRGERLVLV